MRHSSDMASRRRPSSAPCAALLLLALSAATPAAPETGGEHGLLDALKGGKATVDLRYRYEDVSEEASEKHARASTLRTALAYRSQLYRGFSLQIEAENVAVIGNDLYNNGGASRSNNQVRDRPLVLDPADTEINQALIRYHGDRWHIAAGRQELSLGDERFVGDLDWRQNHQSFDALRIHYSLGGLRFTWALVDRVHRIGGDSLDLSAHLFNASFELQNAGKFTLYGYLLDYRKSIFSQLSTATWGLEFAGQRRLRGERALLYEIELAQQSDHAGNPRAIDTGYTALMLGASLPKLRIRIGWEQLGGGRDGPFRTPLADLHDHNGWADTFFNAPFFGLEDLYLRLDGKIGAVDWMVTYHDFEEESRAIPYGEELDLRLLYRARQGVSFGLKGALFDRARFSGDVDKWMVWSAYRF